MSLSVAHREQRCELRAAAIGSGGVSFPCRAVPAALGRSAAPCERLWPDHRDIGVGADVRQLKHCDRRRSLLLIHSC